LDGEKNGLPYYQGFALHPDVTAVAASNSLDRHSYYSNYGPGITICAPSSGSPGRCIVTTDRHGLAGYSWDDYTDEFGGTSSSTPLAAGLAALVLSVRADLTSAEVREILKETADKIDPAGGQYVDGHSPLYGHGRINAQRAVERALPPPVPPREAIDIEITDVGLSIVAPTTSGPARGLAARILFEVSGEDAEMLTAGYLPYQAQVRLISRDDATERLAASGGGQLRPDKLRYETDLEFPIPEPGRYELRTDIILQLPSGDKKAWRLGPMLRVVPG
jgi:hypothetical protein